MKFVNPGGDAQQCKKYKTIRGALTAIPILVALIAGIVLGVFLTSGTNGDIVTKVGLSLMMIGGCELFGGFAAILIHVYAFAKKIEKSELCVEHDFTYNLAICEHCGRFFDFSELSWFVKSTGTTHESRENGWTMKQNGLIHVSSACPSCYTKSGCSIQTVLQEDVSRTTHIIFTDNDKTDTTTTRKSDDDIRAIVRKVYDKNKQEAQQIIAENRRKGYIMETK